MRDTMLVPDCVDAIHLVTNVIQKSAVLRKANIQNTLCYRIVGKMHQRSAAS